MATLRTEAPSTSNKYFKSTANGGLNKCLRINASTGSCLPNCVGYVWGAWYEMLGYAPKLSRGNAKTFFGTEDGYVRGQTPKLGAIACWGGGKYGHVGIVVGIFKDYITVAQSNYGGNYFELVRCYKYGSGYKSHGGNTAFQGFIYYPGAITTGTTSTSKGIKYGFYKGMAKGKKMVTKVALNLRRDASTSAGVVTTIPKGKSVYYYGYYAYNGNVVWYKVAYGKLEGYVYGGVLNSGVAPYLKNANP